jgi:sugar phosphate isomerase/epimerase
MKLSLLTYLLGKDMDLAELLDICRTARVDGIEFRAELGHKHGVELERTPAERAEIKDRCLTAGLPIACLATGCKFEDPAAEKRREEIDRAKHYVDLAADIGAPRIRVFGNAFPAEGITKAEVIANVGAALREIAEHGAARNVDVCLEMHGDFYWWEYTLEAVQIADHPRVGIVHNCDPREMRFGPISSFYEPVKTHIRHVHMHDLENGYPYQAFLGMLKRDGYSGFLSLEADASDDARRVIAIYAELFRAWLAGL